jgi:outer membrane protein OmpA-like peptidoglycan-associated protein
MHLSSNSGQRLLPTAADMTQAFATEGKVAATRMTAFGAGMTGPRSANADDAGRARNRRVELTPR